MNRPWSKDLQCHWVGWVASAPTHLALHLPAGNYCDMCGAIRVAEHIMPDVAQITVYVDGVFDIGYTLADGGWKAFK